MFRWSRHPQGVLIALAGVLFLVTGSAACGSSTAASSSASSTATRTTTPTTPAPGAGQGTPAVTTAWPIKVRQ